MHIVLLLQVEKSRASPVGICTYPGIPVRLANKQEELPWLTQPKNTLIGIYIARGVAPSIPQIKAAAGNQPAQPGRRTMRIVKTQVGAAQPGRLTMQGLQLQRLGSCQRPGSVPAQACSNNLLLATNTQRQDVHGP